MPKDHIIAAHALDCAIHNLSEPSGYHSLIPPDDWGAAKTSGSANIPLMAAVAWYKYSLGTRNAIKAREKLLKYAEISTYRFMLAEPFSAIYSDVILIAIIAAVAFAERAGDHELADKLNALVLQWMALAYLMSAVTKKLPAEYPDPDNEKRSLPRRTVVLHGCRSWGHGFNLRFLYHDIYNIAVGWPSPRVHGKPGDMDGFDFVTRALRHHDIEEVITRAYNDVLHETNIWSLVKFGCRERFQFIGWEDGSRVCIMGGDEEELVDEDQNGNTPGVMWYGVLNGTIYSYPEWPNPRDGRTRIRQQNMFADIDGNTDKGWTLLHSAIGRLKHISGKFITNIPAYKGSKLIFHKQLNPSGELVDLLNTGNGGTTTPPDDPPVPPVEPSGGNKPSLWEKIWSWIKKHF